MKLGLSRYTRNTVLLLFMEIEAACLGVNALNGENVKIHQGPNRFTVRLNLPQNELVSLTLCMKYSIIILAQIFYENQLLRSIGSDMNK